MKVSAGSIWMGKHSILRVLSLVRPENMLTGSIVKLFSCALQELCSPRYLAGIMDEIRGGSSAVKEGGGSTAVKEVAALESSRGGGRSSGRNSARGR